MIAASSKSGAGSAAAHLLLASVWGGGKMGVVRRTGEMRLRIGCGLGSGCRCAGMVGVSRGRGRHCNHQLAGLRRNGDAGNGQRGGVVRRYFENGVSAGKGWGKCGRGVAYWPGKKARMGMVGDGGCGVSGWNGVAGVLRGRDDS